MNESKFNPGELYYLDNVLVRNSVNESWVFSYFRYFIYEYPMYKCRTPWGEYSYCIPYNEETKHLLGTAYNAPEHYRYWDDFRN